MGGKHATSTSKVTIPPEVLARYNAVNARAEKVAETPYEKFGTAPTDFVAQMNEQQAAGTSTINTAGGPAYEGIDKYMSPYIRNVADTTGAMMRQQQEQAQSGALGTAISSGAFGGDRAGIAAANLQQQNEMGYGKTMADIMNQGYTQALGASQADLGRKLQVGQTQLAAGTMQQQTEQAGKDAMIKQFMQEKGYPFQVAQYLANIAMGTGALSGSTTTSTQPLGIFGNLATGGRVGKEGGGGVSGPMSDSQGDIWDESYVPGGLLPVGRLMTAEVPSQDGGGGNGDAIMKLLSMGMGKAEGGGVSGRNGYAEGGGSAPLSPAEMEQFRARQERMKNPDLDMWQGGEDFGATRPSIDRHGITKELSFRNDGGENVAVGPQPSQPSQFAWGTGNGRLEGGARAEAALPTRPQNTGESISEFTYPLRRSIGAGATNTAGMLSDGIWGGFSGLPTALGAGLSGLGAQDYGGNYLLNLGKSMRGVAGDIYENSAKQATEIENTPWRSSVTSLPAQPTGVVARPVLSATGDIAGGPGATAGGAGTYEVPTPGGLAPATSIIPPARPQVATGVQPPEGGASVARDALSTLGVKASGVAPAPAATGAEDPGAVFDTKIVGQESGDNQYDQNGNPLTSPKGAVGAAQVMEATGPEAARLAGVEWDRNRWLHDKEYNKQLGKAYFLEQYRRFGSIDKAAAAYNAGPTALAQAIDRSTALGGSYLDYLPAETQNYVKNVAGVGNGATSPSGVAGPDGEAPQNGGGLAAANMSGTGKPYAERGMIGQFFHDPQTGKLRPEAVKATLGFLAAMAKSNTVSPISALLQGLGGGMEAYSAAQKQAADIASTQAGTEQTKVATSNARFTVGPDGMPMVIMPDGSRVDFYTFTNSDELKGLLGTAQTAAIIKAAEAAGVDKAAPEQGGGVYSSPTVQSAISAETDTLRALGGDRTQSNEAISTINNAAAAAGGGVRANTFMQLNAFADLNANPAAAAGGFKAPVRAAAVQALNYASSVLGLPPISDMSEDAAIIAKASAILGTDAAQRLDAETLGALNVIMTSLPNIDQDPKASAKLMASIIQGQQRAVDLKNFTDGYIRRDNGNQTLTAFGAEKAFNDQTAQLYEAEKPYLETLILEGGKTVDPSSGMTPVQLLTSGQLNPQETAEVLAQLFPGGYPPHLVTTFSR